jgi:Protein of unknown function (DUF3021)
VKKLFRNAFFAALSLTCVALGFLFYGAFVVSGTNHRLGNSMDKVAQFAVLSPCLIGIVLGLASLIWNRRKTPGLIALLVAVAGTCVVYAIGG